jgi:hypothetical protein
MTNAGSVLDLPRQFTRALNLNEIDGTGKSSHLSISGAANRTGEAVFENNNSLLPRLGQEFIKIAGLGYGYKVLHIHFILTSG